MSTQDIRPEMECPKCDSPSGFLHLPPHYVAVTIGVNGEDRVVSEHLEWTCGTCGYVIKTPTADAA